MNTNENKNRIGFSTETLQNYRVKNDFSDDANDYLQPDGSHYHVSGSDSDANSYFTFLIPDSFQDEEDLFNDYSDLNIQI